MLDGLNHSPMARTRSDFATAARHSDSRYFLDLPNLYDGTNRESVMR